MVLYQVKILFKYLLRSTQFSFILLCVYCTLNAHGTDVYHATLFIVPTWSYMMILSAMVYNDVDWKKQTNRKTDLLTNYPVFLLDTCQDKHFVCCECTEFFLCMIWEHRRFRDQQHRTLFFFSTLLLYQLEYPMFLKSELKHFNSPE